MSEKTFTSPLASHLRRFQQFKCAAGYRYDLRGRDLRVMDRFFALHLSPADPVITDSVIRAFVTLTEKNAMHRLTLMRQFCRYLSLEEPRTAIPPRSFLGIRHKPFIPRILTRDEGKRFLQACLFTSGQASLCQVVHGTMLLALYLTGMRVGEVLSLRLEDVDLSTGVVRIRQGKFKKSRLVPLAGDVTDRMEQCRLLVDRHLGVRPPEAYFFPGREGSRYTADALRLSFRKVLSEAGIPYEGKGKGPRLHDLRHSYAILRMMLWYKQGADLGALLPLLATYLGHVGLSSTQYYLRLTEDLLGVVLGRYQERFGHLIEERRTV
ncbi:MAG: tyrosine-type recombinase/integrase [Syntrophorhabdales bacterium]|jgi:integrase